MSFLKLEIVVAITILLFILILPVLGIVNSNIF